MVQEGQGGGAGRAGVVYGAGRLCRRAGRGAGRAGVGARRAGVV